MKLMAKKVGCRGIMRTTIGLMEGDLMKFVFDLDGTICFKGQPIVPEILQALHELTELGHEVIFASARPIRDMLSVIARPFHGYPMIGGNGSMIFLNGEIVHSTTFSLHEMQLIKQWIEEHRTTYLIDSDWDYAYTGSKTHPIRKNVDPANLAQCCPLEALDTITKVLFLTADRMEKLAEKLEELDVYVHRHGQENVLDVSPKGVHKWSALQRMGVEEQAYIAFGNDANDQTMFEKSLYSVRIGSYESLELFASETIELAGDYEQTIVERIQELGRQYHGYSLPE